MDANKCNFTPRAMNDITQTTLQRIHVIPARNNLDGWSVKSNNEHT